MSLTRHDVNAVLQLSSDYLETVVKRYIAFNSTLCLDTGAAPIPVGEQMIAADNVTYEVTDVGFSFDGSETTADVTISEIDGTLEVGEDVDDLQQVSTTTLPFPLSIDNHAMQANVLVVEVQIPFQQNPRFQFDLSPLSSGLGGLSLPSDPARLKVLSDGSVAAGITFAGSPGSDFSSFLNDYDDSSVGLPGDDWALVLDEWTIGQYVDTIDVDANQKKLRNTDVDLNHIDDQGFHLDVEGEAKKKTVFGNWWDFCADASGIPKVTKAGTNQSTLSVSYTVVDAHLCDNDSAANVIINVEKKLRERNQDSGTVDVMSPVQFGKQSDPAGRFDGTRAGTDDGELVIYGTGTKEAAMPANSVVEPEKVRLVTPCASNVGPTGTFEVRNESEGQDQAPLDVCTVELWDTTADFDLSGPAVGGTNTLNPGTSSKYEAEYTGSSNDLVRENVRVATSEGTETVHLRAYPSVGTVDAPESVSMEAEEEVEDCVCGTITVARALVEVTNTGTGPVEVCDVFVSNAQGGTWSTGQFFRNTQQGDVAPDRLFSGEKGFVEVTYDASTLDVWRSATLTIETSGNDETVDLRGRVNSYDGEEMEPRESEQWCQGGVVIGSHNICLSAEGIYVVNEAVQQIINRLFDEYPLGDVTYWEGLVPECGPRMLCRQIMEVYLEGIPSDYRVEFSDPDGGPRYRHEPTGGAVTMLVPMDGERVEMLQEVGGDIVEREVTGHIKAWSLQRLQSWGTEQPLAGVDAVEGRIATLQDGTVRLFDPDESGQPVEIDAYELDGAGDGLVGLGNFVVVYGDEGLLTLRPAADGLHRVGEGAKSFSLLVPTADHSPSRRFAYGVREDGISLLDLTDPARPTIEWTADERVDGSVTTGFAADDTLLLAGEDIVAGWRVDEDGLDSAGYVDVDGVVSVFGGEDTAYAVSESGNARIITVPPDGSLEERGVINFPDDWESVLPSGRPSVVGDGKQAVARRLDRQGFNVLQLRQGEYRPEGP